MFTPGFSQTERALFEATLCKSHKIRIGVRLLDLNMNPAPRIGNVTSDISKFLIDGQVSFSAGADISVRSLSATFLDPKSDLLLESGDPRDGVLFVDRMLQITYEVWVPDVDRIEKWMAIPIFTGPITKLDRAAGVLTLEATGKETLAGLVYKPYTIPATTKKIDAIRQILKYGGENFFFDLGTSDTPLGKAVVGSSAPKPQSNSTSSTEEPENTNMWSQAEDIAQGMDSYLYYDGLGRVNLRKFSDISLFTFRDGSGGSVIGLPQLSFDSTGLVNTVRRDGALPSSGSAPTFTDYIKPSTDPLSPESLGRIVDGTLVPRYLIDIQQSDALKNIGDVTSAVSRALTEFKNQSVDVTFDSLVIPHLEPNDQCTLQTTIPGLTISFRLRTYSIPLNASGVMTVGYTTNQIINVPDIRNRGPF